MAQYRMACCIWRISSSGLPEFFFQLGASRALMPRLEDRTRRELPYRPLVSSSLAPPPCFFPLRSCQAMKTHQFKAWPPHPPRKVRPTMGLSSLLGPTAGRTHSHHQEPPLPAPPNLPLLPPLPEMNPPPLPPPTIPAPEPVSKPPSSSCRLEQHTTTFRSIRERD